MNIVNSELRLSDEAIRSGDIEKAWGHLSDAHILSQPYPWPHFVVHWRMLLLALQTRDGVEIFGQLVRLILAAPGSMFGKYPKGNTGRSDVSMFLPMQIPDRLESRLPKPLNRDQDRA